MTDGFIRQSNKKEIDIENIVTVLYMEYGKDFAFAGEKHDFWEFVYIDKGTAEFTADSRQFLLKGGEIAFHKPNEFHKLSSSNEPTNVTIVSFVCRSSAMRFFENKIFRLTARERTLLSDLLDEGLHAFAPLSPAPPVMGMQERENAPAGARQLTFGSLEKFLITLYRRGDDAIVREKRHISPIEKEDYPAKMYDILRYLEQNLSLPLSVRDIAAHFGMGVSTLKKYVSQYLPCGILHYFNDRKIARAKLLIREQNYNFTEIADLLGFASVHYFSRFFKQKTGVTPTEYAHSIRTA